jgi:hypothetical protein
MPTSQFGQHVLALAKTAYSSLGAVSDSLAQLIHLLQGHVHVAHKVYPTGAAGVTLTEDGATPWTLGAIVEIVPASTITSQFDITEVNVEAISADGVYEIVLYKGGAGSETEIGRFRVAHDTATGAAAGAAQQDFSTVIVEANARISAAVMSENGSGATVDVSIGYHEH